VLATDPEGTELPDFDVAEDEAVIIPARAKPDRIRR
jgi:hypothetical protein